jgi:hypothetical protein
MKIYKKEKKKSKSIIVNGVEYRPYKKSKTIFLEHQQENLEDIERKHIYFLNNMDQKQVNEIEKFLNDDNIK